MARTKKKPPIIGAPDELHIVVKSRPIMLMRDVPFELGELKVLDTYLARINPKDPAATTVRFTKEEYEDLMGIERMRPERLSKYVKSIMSKVVEIKDSNRPGKWKQYTLFEESVCDQDENNQWYIDLTCTRTAKKLFFNVDKIGYTRYQLKNVLPMKSKYSVLLYIYLMDNRFRKEWEVDLQFLREQVFRCFSEYYAATYKDFRRDILDKALKEVNQFTDLEYTYTPVKTGVKITGIHWTLIKDEVALPVPREFPVVGEDGLTDEERAEIENMFEEPEDETPQEYMQALLKEIVPDCSSAQLEELINIAYTHVPASGSIIPRENRIVDYIKAQVLYTKTRTPKNFYTYLRGAVQKNYAKWKGK